MRSLLALPLLALRADAFYLPGVSPHEYADGEKVATLKGDAKKIAGDFIQMVEDYVKSHYSPQEAQVPGSALSV